MKTIALAFTSLLVFLATGAAFGQTPELVVQTGHLDTVTSVAFSPDSKLLASAGRDNTVNIWTTDTARQLRSLVGHTDKVTSVAFGADGTVVSASYDGTARIWEIASGRLLRTLSGHMQAIDSLSLSPDGGILATGSHDKTIKLWETGSGRELRTLHGHSGDIASLAFSPDGKTLASGSHDHSVRLWDVATGREIRSFSGHAVAVMGVAFSPDGRYIASSGGGFAGRGVAFVWDRESGRARYKFVTNDEWISSVTFSPDGRFLIGGTNTSGRALHLWDLTTGKEVGLLPTRASAVYALAFSPDAKLFAYGGSHNSVTLMDPKTWKELPTLDGHVRPVDAVAMSRDGRVLAASNRSGIRLWDLTLPRELRKIDSKDVTAVAISPDGSVAATASYDKTVRLWDAASGTNIHTLAGHDAAVRSVAFTPDGTVLASGGDDNNIRLWNAATGKEIRTLTGHVDFIPAIAFSQDGRLLASGSGDTTIKLWDVATGREIRMLAGHANWVKSVAFSPDGRYLLSGSGDKTAILWEVSTGREVRTFQGHADSVTSVSFSPDGRHAVTASSDENIKVWDVKSGSEVKTLKGYSGAVASVLFSRDGKSVFSGSSYGVIKKWNAERWEEDCTLIGFNDGEWIVATPQGYFNASINGAKYLNVRVGDKVYSIDQFYSSFYRPELVELALAGKEISKARDTVGNILVTHPAPNVRIISPLPESTIGKDSVAVTVKVADNGGGIGDVNLYLNGSQVANETRGVAVKAKPGAGERTITFTVALVEGENEIKAVAFNKENTMESNPAVVKLVSRIVLSKPNLYALVIGINEYRNKSIALSYAVSDARAFAETLKKSAKPLFGETDVRVLVSPEATTREAITKAVEALRVKVRPNDLFVFYDASHGLVDVVENEEQYFLLTSNVLLLSSRHIARDAMSQKELARLLGTIPAQKKVVILDTCNAGKGGKEIQVALLQQTRGLTESTAAKLLQRAIGSAVFSASSDTQQAVEGYKGHGLFTYVLMEGLKGEADLKKDGYITILGLADYVEEHVTRLSEEHFKRQQTPTIQIGANFPIGKVR